MWKPFKPPLLKSTTRPAPIDLTYSDTEDRPSPAKKIKSIHYSEERIEDSPPRKSATSFSAGVFAPRKPLLVVKNPKETEKASENSLESVEEYYKVVW